MRPLDDNSYGGYSERNVYRWLLREVYESGDFMNFFRVIRGVVEAMDDDMCRSDTLLPHSWDKYIEEGLDSDQVYELTITN